MLPEPLASTGVLLIRSNSATRVPNPSLASRIRIRPRGANFRTRRRKLTAARNTLRSRLPSRRAFSSTCRERPSLPTGLGALDAVDRCPAHGRAEARRLYDQEIAIERIQEPLSRVADEDPLEERA